MIKEYDKRDLMKNFLKSKLSIAPLRVTLEIDGETFYVPTKEYHLKNEEVMNYYNYVIEAVKNEALFDNFFKILALQSWPISYIPGRQNNERYMFLRNYIIARMEEYNIIYLRLVRNKELQDANITINRTHMVGRVGTENFFDYSTSPFYIFYLDGKEYMVPSFNVQKILNLIESRAPKAKIVELLEKEQHEDHGKLQKSHNRPRRQARR